MNPGQVVLAQGGLGAVKPARKNPAMAVESFTDEVMAKPELLAELLREIRRAELLPVAMRYLQARRADMAGMPANGGACRSSVASHPAIDRPSAQNDARACHRSAEGQTSSDRPGVTETDR